LPAGVRAATTRTQSGRGILVVKVTLTLAPAATVDDGSQEPPPVLLFRSGRHLAEAVKALRRAYPDRRVRVVTQPGTESQLMQAGVDSADALLYDAGRFSPLRFAFSRTGWQTRRVGASPVAMLWNDAWGYGQLNVVFTAALLSRRLVAITPDGALKDTTWLEPLKTAIVERLRPLTHRIRHVWLVAGERWDALRSRIEGPELEPRPWHSHYLTTAIARRDCPALGRQLSGTVLDIGSGTGQGRDFLDPARTRYLPTDLPTGRDSDDTTITTRGVRPRLHCSGAALPLLDQSVDGVMALSVLEHVRNVKSILDEAFRVLRPGGRLLVTVPFAFPFHGEPNDFWRWTIEGFAEQLRRSGFEPEAHQRNGASLTSLVINLNIMVKYSWRSANSPMLRAISRWGWPLAMPAQAMANAAALALDRGHMNSTLPMFITFLARRP
jgi:SAM-dependent methyltransferase